ncbi:MAG: scc2 [Parachlamydiales bacterium]|nr:scc2 [Parachlamydiales bacterium]
MQRLLEMAKVAPKIDCESFYAHAYALYQANSLSQAAEVFQVLCARSPLDQRFWFGLGASCQESGRFAEAERAWAMAALLDPLDPYPHFYAAQCAHSLNQTDDAALALLKAEERTTDLEHPLHEVVLLLKEQWRNRCPALMP